MAKDKSVNPVAAQHKADKQRALKKNKANVAAQRNDRLAKRNPERLQRQIDDLKGAEERGEPLRPRDRETLNNLEKEVRAIRKAREALGDRAPTFGGGGGRGGREGGGGGGGGGRGRGRGGGGVLGKRRRDGRGGHDDDGSESSETDEDVRDIPMPRDTPPPIPRKPRRGGAPSLQDETPARDGPHPLPARPGAGTAAAAAAAAAEAKTVYSAAPIHRDLRKEATSRFVPAAVAQKLAAAKGQTPGKLLEPEELDRLEKQGYGQKKAETAQAGMRDAEQAAEAAVEEAEYRMMNAEATAGEDVDIDEEAARFERELKQVEMEEVEDEAFAD
ncbi:ww domain binding protein 11 [Diplodia corticola]|uniref:Ww domain binding protein 11 n=1 Tax=Diplodia corticola TaxID=236234 RepID=A0A1J9S4Q3_9PEZI|nr:ww domain binding protein 11 [Diplodia corticola]OJD35511.1 ww domain binding protein 11 [Diplodia corticola]